MISFGDISVIANITVLRVLILKTVKINKGFRLTVVITQHNSVMRLTIRPHEKITTTALKDTYNVLLTFFKRVKS